MHTLTHTELLLNDLDNADDLEKITKIQSIQRGKNMRKEFEEQKKKGKLPGQKHQVAQEIDLDVIDPNKVRVLLKQHHVFFCIDSTYRVCV